jgi:homoserine kinase type II
MIEKSQRMTPIQPTMLWESTNAEVALTQRFQFVSVEEATRWLVNTVSCSYGVLIESVDRLVISSANLLAWLTTTDGPLIAKCCAVVSAHEWLSNVAELLVWLDQERLPVSVPLRSRRGKRQVLCDHLSLGVQRVMPGNLLDPTQLVQARTAGLILARLHNAFAAYSRATDFAIHSPLPALGESIREWVETKEATLRDSSLDASIKTLTQSLQRDALSELTSQVVHHDYRSANILWLASRITAVLDFEELRLGYRVNDLAWAAVHLGTRFRHWGPVSAEVHRAFFVGYESLHPLTEAEQAWMPVLMSWHSLKLADSATGTATYPACIDSVITYTRLLDDRQSSF